MRADGGLTAGSVQDPPKPPTGLRVVTSKTTPGQTVVTLSSERFTINGNVTHPGTAAEGLLLNSRMVQAIYDDENSSTVGNVAYPDTGVWSAERNVTEFIAALPLYASRGLRAVTVSLQGAPPAGRAATTRRAS